MNGSKEASGAPRVVVFGGGTGMHSLLSGLKAYAHDITAIVAVTDDGGSSGLLRSELDIPPPGDIRNCMLALSNADPLLKELLSWRFESGELESHNLGNLLIAAATLIKRDFAEAVKGLHEILAVRGRVIPSTPQKVGLVAHHGDGSSTTGEVRITRSGRPIHKLELRPEPVGASEEVLSAIGRADFFIFGPGSLFTSIIPNLLVPGIVAAMRQCSAPCLYIGNIMSQPGETDGYTLSDHLHAIERHAGEGLITEVLASTTAIPPDILSRYKSEGSEPVVVDRENIRGPALFTEDLADNQHFMRHNADRLAEQVMHVYKRGQREPFAKRVQ